MKSITKIHLIATFFVLVFFTGCVKEEHFPIEPAIQFGGFGTLADVSGKDSLGAVMISYTDGDGDIGLYPTDTVEPYKYNFYLKLMQMNKGQLTEFKFADTTLNFNARIPILTPAGRNKNIKGEITNYINLYLGRSFLKSDTIAFEIYIKDRALHKSNIIKTPLFKIKR